MSKTISAALFGIALATPMAAQAQSTPAQSTGPAPSESGGWSFLFGGATDNRSKSASKSDGNPYVYGTAEWESADGLFYAAPGFETIDNSNGAKLELQAYAGVRPQVAGFDLDLKLAFKQHVDADPGTDDDAWEVTANLSRSIGPASARLQVQHTPDGTGSVRDWTWVEGRLGWDFTSRLTGTVAVGRREQDNSVDYTGWNAGVNYALNRRTDLDLRWHDTDADVPGEQYKGALVAAVNFSF